MDKKKLEEEKMDLVDMLNKVNKEIDGYGLNDFAVSSGPLKEMISRRERIEFKISLVNKQLECWG